MFDRGDKWIALMLALLGLAAFLMAGCERGLSTASPDVKVTKSNENHFHGDVYFPNRVTIDSSQPSQRMSESGIGLFNQRHNADSDTGLESQLENAMQLSDLLNPEVDAQVNPGGAGSQD